MKFLTIMNHSLSSEQKEYAQKEFKVNEFLFLPDFLKEYFLNISPFEDLDLEKLSLVTKFIKDNLKKGDFVLIQTEFGVTFYLVDFCLKNDFVPVYATSNRIYEEKINNDGSVSRKHVFKFVKFRKYRYYVEFIKKV